MGLLRVALRNPLHGTIVATLHELVRATQEREGSGRTPPPPLSLGAFGGVSTRSGERSGDFAGELGGGGFAVGGFLEEEDGGQGFAGDVVSPEDGDHLVGQD